MHTIFFEINIHPTLNAWVPARFAIPAGTVSRSAVKVAVLLIENRPT